MTEHVLRDTRMHAARGNTRATDESISRLVWHTRRLEWYREEMSTDQST